jgi:Family of unknown function (DUF6893)
MSGWEIFWIVVVVLLALLLLSNLRDIIRYLKIRSM